MTILSRINRKMLTWYYGRQCGSFGIGSVMEKPYLLASPQNIHIGNKVLVRQGARIEPVEHWRGVDYQPKISIGDDSFIELNVHIAACQSVEIGKQVVIAANCFISDHDHDYQDINLSVMEQLLTTKGPVKIGDQSWVGENVCILSGVTIGKHCVIAAHSVVVNEVPDYSVVAGVPARVIKKYDPDKKQWVIV